MAAQTTTVKENPAQTQEKVIFSWTAPTRPFKRQSREVYITLISVGVLFGLILFLIDGLMPVLLIVALFFLFYVVSNIEPEHAEYRITTYGVRIAGSLISWENFGRFWFSERMGSSLVVLEKAGLVGRLELVIDEKDKEKITKALSKYMLHEEIASGFLDKSANWIADKIQK